VSRRALLSLDVPAQAESLRTVRGALGPALDRLGVAPVERDRLVLAVDEAVANVIRHAYGNTGEGRVRFTLACGRGMLRFKLRDWAPRVDPSRIKPRDLSVCRPGGLGINFIDETMDHWCVRPQRHGGNVLVMCKRLRTRPATENRE
jgi:sigma-B regulation protein RsbU (phosphoserine phosphatase)